MDKTQPKSGLMARMLDGIERVGNKLPDPSVLFLILMIAVWAVSALLSNISFSEINPRTGEAVSIVNLLAPEALVNFLVNMVPTFTSFAPLGVVLVAMLGIGVAEHSGFITTALKKMLKVTPVHLLTPAVALVGIISHTATDAGYVVVIPVAGVLFYAVGRHPLAGVMAAFAGVSGGFCANFIPSAIDPLLQSFTQAAAQTLDPTITLNPLNNWFFAASSGIPIILVIWYLTDKVMEPRLNANTPINDDIEVPKMDEISDTENKAFRLAVGGMLSAMALVVLVAFPESSPLRDANGELSNFASPLMRSIVPLIFIFFVIPGIIFGFANKTYTNSGDVIKSMNKAIEGMAAYIVMAFFCAQFIAAFGQSELGVLLAVKGANFLQSLGLPAAVTIVGLVLLVSFVNLFMGSASAKWALIGPVLVPMLMQLGISPDLSQAAYRIGDSSSNIISPLMPYFPLVVVYCQRYVKSTGVGTLIASMFPYSIALLLTWTIWLLLYWAIGLPLGLGASYTYGG